MNIEHLEGHRAYQEGRQTRIDIWGKSGYSLDPFMENTPWEVDGGWQIKNVRLSGSDVWNVIISGLEITTNDVEVKNYSAQFGVKGSARRQNIVHLIVESGEGEKFRQNLLDSFRGNHSPIGDVPYYWQCEGACILQELYPNLWTLLLNPRFLYRRGISKDL